MRSQLLVLGIGDHASIVASLSTQVAGSVVERTVLPARRCAPTPPRR